MKTIDGARFRALAKRSRTREAPSPTKSSTKLDPVTEKKGTPASPATALAISVLPVPGGPTISTPRGPRAPIRAYRWGCFRKSTTSLTSCLAPSYPAMSANVVLGRSSSYSLAREPVSAPRPMKPPPPPTPRWARRPMYQNTPRKRIKGSRLSRMVPSTDDDGPWAVICTLCCRNRVGRLLSCSAVGICVV